MERGVNANCIEFHFKFVTGASIQDMVNGPVVCVLGKSIVEYLCSWEIMSSDFYE